MRDTTTTTATTTTPQTSKTALKIGGRLACLVTALGVSACAATPETAPAQEPLPVAVTQMSPEVLDEIADRVAARLEPAVAQQRQRGLRVVEVPVRRVQRPGVDPATRAVRVRRDTKPAELARYDALTADPKIDEAIDGALTWLAARQSTSGLWSTTGKSGDAAAAGDPRLDVGVTGLAVLAFLGEGHTHQSGEHSEVMKRAFQALRTAQDSEGCIGPRVSQHFMYNHAVAALALVEGYNLTQSPLLRDAARNAIGFAMHAQNPYLGWRYGVRDGDNDTSMTAWMTLLLGSARDAGFDVDSNVFKGAHSWVEKMTESEFGRTGYNTRGGQSARLQSVMDTFPSEWSEGPTAAGMTVRVIAGEDPAQSETLQKGAAVLTARLPRWDTEVGSIDMYYWFWGTHALSHVGGNRWNAWTTTLVPQLLEHQTQTDDIATNGSWAPVGAWGVQGGRVYSTAICSLMLSRINNSLK